jgi:hypothetical protein
MDRTNARRSGPAAAPIEMRYLMPVRQEIVREMNAQKCRTAENQNAHAHLPC